MKLLIKKLKHNTLFGIIIGGIIFGSIGIYAASTYNASDILYTKDDGTTTNVNAIINDLNTTINNLSGNCSASMSVYKLENKIYEIGESVNWAEQNWYVINDSQDSVTLILNGNSGKGSYGTASTFENSSIYNNVNNEFVSNNPKIAEAIDEGALASQGKNNGAYYYVRIPTRDELSSHIPNNSGTAFWTKTNSGNGLYIANKTGEVLLTKAADGQATYYSGYSMNLSSITFTAISKVIDKEVVTAPNLTEATISSSIVNTASTSYGSISHKYWYNDCGYESGATCGSNPYNCSKGNCESKSFTYYKGGSTCSTATGSYQQYKEGSGYCACTSKRGTTYYSSNCRGTYYTLSTSSVEIGYRPVVTVYKK